MKHHPQDFSYRHYLAPRWWPTWIVVGLMWLISTLPWRAVQATGAGIGILLHKLGGSRRRVTEVNIAKCFPELSPEAQAQLVRNTFIANAKGYTESTIGWFRNIDRYVERMEVHGREHIQAVLNSGQGVLLVGAHFSMMDMALPLVARTIPVSYMYRPNDNGLLNAMVEKNRRRYCKQAFTKFELREMIEHIAEGNAVWYAIDQDMGPKHSVFAPFFGVPAASVKAAGWLARESGAAVIMLSQFRGENGVYTLRFTPVNGVPTDDEVANATAINKTLESEIRRDPAQYLWLHRRFKTRPEGEASFYGRKS